MFRFTLNTMLVLFVLGGAHVVKSQDLQKGQENQVRVYLKRALPELETQLIQERKYGYWLIKHKTLVQSFENDTLRIKFLADDVYRESNPNAQHWKTADLEKGEQVWPIHRNEIAKMEIKTGNRSSLNAGAMLGGMAGAAVGKGIQAGEYDGWDGWLLITVPIGCMVGGIIGTKIKQESWLDVPLEKNEMRKVLSPYSKVLQKNHKVRVYLRNAIPELETQIKQERKSGYWLLKPKAQILDFVDTRLTIEFLSKDVYRDSDPNSQPFETAAREKSEQEWPIHRNEIAKVEVKTGDRSNFIAGALLGSILGAGTGATLGVLTTDEYSDDRAIATGFGAIGGFAGGFALGGIIGGSMKTEKWLQMPLDQIQVHITISH